MCLVACYVMMPQVSPVYGWVLSYEWGFMLLGLLYGSYLRACYRWGRRAGHHAALQVPKVRQGLASGEDSVHGWGGYLYVGRGVRLMFPELCSASLCARVI